MISSIAAANSILLPYPSNRAGRSGTRRKNVPKVVFSELFKPNQLLVSRATDHHYRIFVPTADHRVSSASDALLVHDTHVAQYFDVMKGANPDERSEEGVTALHVAARQGDVMVSIMAHGAGNLRMFVLDQAEREM